MYRFNRAFRKHYNFRQQVLANFTKYKNRQLDKQLRTKPSDKVEITYSRIEAYYKAYKSNIKTCHSLESFMQVVKENEATPDFCIFEVLSSDRRRMYFDIENIPSEYKTLINDLIKDLAEFLDIDKENYALSLNTGSRHPGLSYHLTFPYVTAPLNILNSIRNFKLKYPKYKEYIDELVYSNHRLFRLPNQHGILQKDDEQLNRELDVHRIIKGKFEDFIVQNVQGLPDYEKRHEYVPAKKLRYSFFSNRVGNNERNHALNIAKEVCQQSHDVLIKNIELTEKLVTMTTDKHSTVTKEMLYMILIALMAMIVVIMRH